MVAWVSCPSFYNTLDVGSPNRKSKSTPRFTRRVFCVPKILQELSFCSIRANVVRDLVVEEMNIEEKCGKNQKYNYKNNMRILSPAKCCSVWVNVFMAMHCFAGFFHKNNKSALCCMVTLRETGNHWKKLREKTIKPTTKGRSRCSHLAPDTNGFSNGFSNGFPHPPFFPFVDRFSQTAGNRKSVSGHESIRSHGRLSIQCNCFSIARADKRVAIESVWYKATDGM